MSLYIRLYVCIVYSFVSEHNIEKHATCTSFKPLNVKFYNRLFTERHSCLSLRASVRRRLTLNHNILFGMPFQSLVVGDP